MYSLERLIILPISPLVKYIFFYGIKKMTNEFKEVTANKISLSIRKPIFNIGNNDAEYTVYPTINGKQVMCPYYAIWVSMLRRCYDTNFHKKQPTYKDCYVCTEWLDFSNFRTWMETQDWKNKVLDKDILVRGNKEYSPETCIFVTRAVNNLLTDRKAKRGLCKLGVNWCKTARKYKAHCNIGLGKQKALGAFNTEEEAHNAYCIYKAKVIIEVANKQTDVRIKSALLIRASEIHLQE